MSPRTRPSRSYAALKRALDVVGSLALLVLFSPVLLIVTLAILVESPGPVLFRQYRTGKDARRFPMLKFRTMVPNAEALKASLAHLNVLEPPDFKIPNDPRITRVGRFLRRTSLDELPQLLNVLIGHMTLVGPRPTSFAASEYDLWHTSRLEVKPGLTGPWQIGARHESTFDERLRTDLRYVERQSIFADLKIMLKTVGAVLRRSGA